MDRKDQKITMQDLLIGALGAILLYLMVCCFTAAARAQTVTASGECAPPECRVVYLPAATPTPVRVIDRSYLAVLGGEAAATSSDFYTTALILGRGGHETDFVYGTNPSDHRLVLENLGLFATEGAALYELKKPHDWLPGDRVVRRLWWLPAAYWIGDHVYLTGKNIEVYRQQGADRNIKPVMK
jgi:hypothetical protein